MVKLACRLCVCGILLTAASVHARDVGIKRRLERQLREESPTHRLLFKNGDFMTGRVLRESATMVVFEETYGESGEISVQIARERIRAIEPIESAIPEVTSRDVDLAADFPTLRFYKRPPYTIVTDESFFRVERFVAVLEDLHRRFLSEFGSLSPDSRRRHDIQVVFISSGEAYHEYQRLHMPEASDSAGFYSLKLDRLVMLNPVSSESFKQAMERVALEDARHRKPDSRPELIEALDEWRRDAERDILNIAEEQTMRVLRHEGAHQLFFGLGITRAENTGGAWLVEGLATYCDSPQFGALDRDRVELLRQAVEEGILIPLDELLAVPRLLTGPTMNPQRLELAYAQAWSLVRMLMRDRRSAFLSFVAHLRDSPPSTECAIDQLSRFLGISSGQLAEEWRMELKGL